MEIVPLTVDKIKQFKEFVVDFLPNNFPEFNEKVTTYILYCDIPLRTLHEVIQFNKYQIYIALEDERIAGFIQGSMSDAGVGFIHWLGVHNDFRGRGIARQLLQKYEEFLTSRKAHMYELYSPDRNVEIYQKLGFTLVCRREEIYYGATLNMLEKRLGKWTGEYIDSYFERLHLVPDKNNLLL